MRRPRVLAFFCLDREQAASTANQSAVSLGNESITRLSDGSQNNTEGLNTFLFSTESFLSAHAISWLLRHSQPNCAAIKFVPQPNFLKNHIE